MDQLYRSLAIIDAQIYVHYNIQTWEGILSPMQFKKMQNGFDIIIFHKYITVSKIIFRFNFRDKLWFRYTYSESLAYISGNRIISSVSGARSRQTHVGSHPTQR